jgi:hypothetical protein
METNLNFYPSYICMSCGIKYGKKGIPPVGATWHLDICDICGRRSPLTQPRDFGNLKPKWKEHKK